MFFKNQQKKLNTHRNSGFQPCLSTLSLSAISRAVAPAGVPSRPPPHPPSLPPRRRRLTRAAAKRRAAEAAGGGPPANRKRPSGWCSGKWKRKRAARPPPQRVRQRVGARQHGTACLEAAGGRARRWPAEPVSVEDLFTLLYCYIQANKFV